MKKAVFQLLRVDLGKAFRGRQTKTLGVWKRCAECRYLLVYKGNWSIRDRISLRGKVPPVNNLWGTGLGRDDWGFQFFTYNILPRNGFYFLWTLHLFFLISHTLAKRSYSPFFALPPNGFLYTNTNMTCELDCECECECECPSKSSGAIISTVAT